MTEALGLQNKCGDDIWAKVFCSMVSHGDRQGAEAVW